MLRQGSPPAPDHGADDSDGEEHDRNMMGMMMMITIKILLSSPMIVDADADADDGHLNPFLLLQDTEIAGVDIPKVVDAEAVQVVVAKILLKTTMTMILVMTMTTMMTRMKTLTTIITKLVEYNV